MTALELANYIRFELKANTTTLPDTDLLPIVNMWMFQMAGRIAGLDEDHFAVEATTDLVANQRQYQNPTDLIKMKYLEAKLDGTNWVRLDETDMNTTKRLTDETSILAIYNNSAGSCAFEKFASGFIILSGAITAVDDGLKLHYISFPGKLTDLTDNTRDLAAVFDSTHDGFPTEFHELLATRCIIAVKDASDNPKALTQDERLFKVNFNEQIDNLAGQNLDKTVIASVPDSGTDNGYNL
jgi:hypothetical protein